MIYWALELQPYNQPAKVFGNLLFHNDYVEVLANSFNTVAYYTAALRSTYFHVHSYRKIIANTEFY